MAQQAKEFNSLLGTGVNAGYKILEDGKVAIDDLGTLFPIITEAEKGFNGMGQYPAEMAKASIPEKEELKSTFSDKLDDVPMDDAYDLSNGVHGIQCLLSYAFRRGFKEGQQYEIEKQNMIAQQSKNLSNE